MKTNYLLLGAIALLSACAQEEFNDSKTEIGTNKNENVLLNPKITISYISIVQSIFLNVMILCLSKIMMNN